MNPANAATHIAARSIQELLLDGLENDALTVLERNVMEDEQRRIDMEESLVQLYNNQFDLVDALLDI